MKINEKLTKPVRPEKIIQFGEGVFLRGFVDVFVQILNDKGLFNGSVVIVKPIPSKTIGKFKELYDQDGLYTHTQRGILGGKVVNETVEVNSISRLVNPYDDYEDFLALARNPEVEFMFSNTTEAGIVYKKEEYSETQVNDTYPAKVCALLYERYKAGLGGLFITACELIDRAGSELKRIVLKHAEDWNLGDDFKDYIENKNKFYNCLVDRIVTGYPENEDLGLPYEDLAADTSEIFHLWVLEGDKEILEKLPFDKAGLNVLVSDNMDMYHKRKVRILNGAHTSLVPYALLRGFTEVGECVNDAEMKKFLEACIGEIIDATEDDELTREMLEGYAKDVLERFANPYIHHKLSAIALNSVSKFTARILPSVLDYHAKFGKYPKNIMTAFDALLKLYKTDMACDMDDVLAFMKTASKEEILKNKDFWGMDLSCLSDEVEG